MVKVLKCHECGSDEIRYYEECSARTQKLSVDAAGTLTYGEVTSENVTDSYFECSKCGCREYNAEEIIADVEVPVKLVCPRCKKELPKIIKHFEPIAHVDLALYPANTVGGYSVEEISTPDVCGRDEDTELYSCPECNYVTVDYNKFIRRAEE